MGCVPLFKACAIKLKTNPTFASTLTILADKREKSAWLRTVGFYFSFYSLKIYIKNFLYGISAPKSQSHRRKSDESRIFWRITHKYIFISTLDATWRDTFAPLFSSFKTKRHPILWENASLSSDLGREKNVNFLPTYGNTNDISAPEKTTSGFYSLLFWHKQKGACMYPKWKGLVSQWFLRGCNLGGV